ncbi:glycosyltransferase family 4 protein [Alkalihalobacillus sp. MEB130]|uniref:glycosyltransferase n=1 Tax=Alkalihalobacillus sp. MEB130 TaxID=2976704 RepID=UPI0028DE2AB3|nr:glycosyltransferase [Alkalihalobacillus sp. MEB130]MDT8860556.1 glycosyltransferase family 4 protein [Alkalihalobacillus sp. MEB130]
MKIGSVTSPKIILFTPYYKENRGNSTTARRLVKGLQMWDATVHVFAYEEEEWTADWDVLFQEVDIYHVIHLKRFTQWIKKHSHLQLKKPYILTSGGTDVNEDLKSPDAVRLMVSVADQSCAITVFSEDGKEKIVHVYPDLADRIYVIPQSVDLPVGEEAPSSVKSIGGNPTLLLPAGLRPVKDVFYVLDECEEMRNKWPDLAFILIGPVLDEQVYHEVVQYEKKHEWFHYVKEVPLEQMRSVYERADVVLNTSISEGQSSAVLEAMAVGKPVVARENSGNASVIQDGETGILFDSPEQFRTKIEEMIMSEKSISKLIEKAKTYIELNHSLEKEMAQFMEVYEHCLFRAYE